MIKLYFEDRNYPFNVYVVPEELRKRFKDYMAGEGAALTQHHDKRFDSRYTFTYVILKDETAYNPFAFEERTPTARDYFGTGCGYASLHCEICPHFYECPEWNRK